MLSKKYSDTTLDKHPNFAAYKKVRMLYGKDFANATYPDVMWHLWDKRINLKWRLIWKQQRD